MKKFKITYRNKATGHVSSVFGKALNLDSALEAEVEAMKLFNKINPSMELVSVERA